MVDTQDGFIPPSETSEQNQSKFSIHATLKRNQKLKRKVHEYRVLERYIKEEDEKLKLYSARLQDKNEKLVARNKKLSKLVKKWHKRAKGYAVHNKVLKRALQGNMNRRSGNLNILVSAARI